MNMPMLQRTLFQAKQWCRRSSRGAVALEFVLSMFIIPTMIFGVYDATQALKTWQRMALAADAIAAMASNCTATNYINGAPLSPNTSCLRPPATPPTNPAPQNYMFSDDAVQILQGIFVYFPEWENQQSDYSVTISAARFTSPNTAVVIWSSGLGSYSLRACGGPLTPQYNYESPTAPHKTSLPQGLYPTTTAGVNSSTPLLIADVTYTYHSWFHNIIGDIAISQSAFLPVRIGSPTDLTALQGGGHSCG